MPANKAINTVLVANVCNPRVSPTSTTPVLDIKGAGKVLPLNVKAVSRSVLMSKHDINVPLYHIQTSGCDFRLFVFCAVREHWCISRLF